MTQEHFSKIYKMSDRGTDFFNSTLELFTRGLSETDYAMLRDSLITLIKSERMDAAACALEESFSHLH